MYKKAIYTLRSNERLTPAVWRMTLEGDTQWITAPGQFVNVELDGCYLRRPISVCDWDERTITLIYKVVGEGTALMAGLRPGARLDLLTGLGNGFDGYEIRRTAVENNVTLFTSLETVKVLLDVLEEITLSVSTIDAK